MGSSRPPSASPGAGSCVLKRPNNHIDQILSRDAPTLYNCANPDHVSKDELARPSMCGHNLIAAGATTAAAALARCHTPGVSSCRRPRPGARCLAQEGCCGGGNEGDLILDAGFLTAVKQEVETRRLDPGYDPSSQPK